MLSVRAQPGLVRIRSLTLPAWLLALLVALHVPLIALTILIASRVPRVVELACDRAEGRCQRLVDGVVDDRIGLAEVTGAAWRVERSGRSCAVLLTTRRGEAWVAVAGERRARAEQDAAALQRFLAGAGPDLLRLRWDHAATLALALVSIPVGLLMVLGVVAWPFTCVADRAARTVAVGWLRRRTCPLQALRAVEVETGAQEFEGRVRRAAARAVGRRPRFAPRLDPRRARLRRIVLITADGSRLPATVWLLPREDPGPAADRLRALLAV